MSAERLSQSSCFNQPDVDFRSKQKNKDQLAHYLAGEFDRLIIPWRCPDKARLR